jgi:hypothetical protein
VLPRETPQDYRQRAAECQKLADDAKDPRARETLLYVVSRWLALADADDPKYEPAKRDPSNAGSK